MVRESIIQELQLRMNSITVLDGYTNTVKYVFRNPEVEPSPETMPCINIFELEDLSVEFAKRSSSSPPIVKKNMRVALESWLQSSSEGNVSKDVSLFLKDIRTALFFDGTTLGDKAANVSESELSRVFRPGISNFIGGIGIILEVIYIEDFSHL